MNFKFILKTSVILAIFPITYLVINNYQQKSPDSTITVEELIEETNFKLEFKNLNELEYTVQDSTQDIKTTGLNKTFSNNDKFDILINENGKISAISFISDINNITEIDLDYLQKIYTFVFDSISSFVFDNTKDIIEKTQSPEYINLNKSNISENGYTTESITLSRTSEIKVTTYYQKNQNKYSAYKISIDILQGNKW